MNADPEVRIWRGGVGTAKQKADYPTLTAEIRHRGARILIRFEDDDVGGEKLPIGFDIRPDVEPLEARVLRRFAPEAEQYVALARSTMRLLGPASYGTPEERWEAMVKAAEPLRESGRAGRGLSPKFFELVAQQYELLVAEGEPHPVKALAGMHSATISAASRWVKEARRRGLLPPKERSRQ